MKRVYNIARSLNEKVGRGWDQHWFFCQYFRSLRDFFVFAKTVVQIDLDMKKHYDVNQNRNTIRDIDGSLLRLKTFKSQNYTILLKDGTNLDSWMRENLKGRAMVYLIYENTIDIETYAPVCEQTQLVIKFTRPSEAMMFKLTHG